jgi:deoxyribodipyrimidine photo-lyase
MPSAINLFWFRRDLRLEDNCGLYYALSSGKPVVPIFIFDKAILNELEDKQDRRVSFIHYALSEMQKQLAALGSTLDVRYGSPQEVFAHLSTAYTIDTVFTNHDYEPYARKRDELIQQQLATQGISFRTFKDQVIFEQSEVVKDDGQPYSVYTPYAKRWKAMVKPALFKSYPTQALLGNFYKQPLKALPTLQQMGFMPADHPRIEPADEMIIRHYHTTRDVPALQGTTRMGIHLRFGTMSVRKLASAASELNEIFLGELIWREFFAQLLWHHPRVVNQSFKKQYEGIRWRNHAKEFERWCEGETGYPIVDAGMRELNETGFMHNRVRMITASFLVKHLLIDWRLGEAYFAKKLLDFDLSSNNANWQWVAGCGCDASPYFRIFNPTSQTKKFDPQFDYIKRWVPEWQSLTYPKPIVDHDMARNRCLKVYKDTLLQSIE